MTVAGPRFIIVGTPRSGTTLLQRLASELPGVAVTPETHFFPLLDRELGGVGALPSSRSGATAWLESYCGHRLTAGLGLEPDRILAHLPRDGIHAYGVFSAVVAELAVGVPVPGEKTPDHLRWWRPLTTADPGLRMISLVRDPRAVAASMLKVPFGMKRPVLVASQWREDLRLVERAERELGERLLRITFEEMVTDPIALQHRLAAFLGVDPPSAGGPALSSAAPQLFPEWEQAWKGRALEPVTASRIEAWRGALDPDQVRQVDAVAGQRLKGLGYAPAHQGRASLSLRDRARVVRHRLVRQRRQYRLDRIRVGGGS